MLDRRSLFAAAAALAVVGYVVATGSGRADSAIGYDEVRKGLEQGSIVLIDVRESGEFVAGHVPGAINLPLSAFSPAALPKPEGKRVVLMCRSGNRSGRAQAAAHGAGRTDVLNYSGSMIEWTAKAGPIATGR
ncbi:MAG: rhodanese-like domain-containing protein [Siculibacillus sp.]